MHLGAQIHSLVGRLETPKVFKTCPGYFPSIGIGSIGGHTSFAGVGWLVLLSRTCDPLMLDHLLSSCGFGTVDTSSKFIQKYNQQVFYDELLMLKDQAAQRAAKLLDPKKCPKVYKEAMRAAVPFLRLPSWHRQHIRSSPVDTAVHTCIKSKVAMLRSRV